MKKTFSAICPVCGKEFSVSTSWNGKEIECPKCKCKFTAQDPASADSKTGLKTKLKIAGFLAAVLLLFFGCWKAYSIWKIQAEKEAQEQFIEKLQTYVEKSEKRPYAIIQNTFRAYDKFFKTKDKIYVKTSLNEILSNRFNMDLPSARSVEKELQQEIQEEVTKNFPYSDEQYMAQLEREVEKHFPMIKYGDKLTVISPRYKTFTGIFYGINSKTIRVNSKTIALIDLSTNTRSKVDPKFNERMRSEYIRDNFGDYKRKKETFRRELKKNLMKKRGYFSMFDSFYSPAEYLESLKKYDEKPEPQPERKQTAEEELENAISQ